MNPALNHHGAPTRAPSRHPVARRARWVFWAFLALAVVLLALEHRAHLPGLLPVLLLACPLMHLFMHHGHGAHLGRHRDEPPAGSDR